MNKGSILIIVLIIMLLLSAVIIPTFNQIQFDNKLNAPIKQYEEKTKLTEDCLTNVLKHIQSLTSPLPISNSCHSDQCSQVINQITLNKLSDDDWEKLGVSCGNETYYILEYYSQKKEETIYRLTAHNQVTIQIFFAKNDSLKKIKRLSWTQLN